MGNYDDEPNSGGGNGGQGVETKPGPGETAPAGPATPPKPCAYTGDAERDRIQQSLLLAFRQVSDANSILAAIIASDENTSRGSTVVTVYPYTGANCRP